MKMTEEEEEDGYNPAEDMMEGEVDDLVKKRKKLTTKRRGNFDDDFEEPEDEEEVRNQPKNQINQVNNGISSKLNWESEEHVEENDSKDGHVEVERTRIEMSWVWKFCFYSELRMILITKLKTSPWKLKMKWRLNMATPSPMQDFDKLIKRFRK